MRFELFLPIIHLLKFITCNESESSEVKRIEITPYYDTIVFSDVVDIINELSKNLNSPFNAVVNSESESEENVEDLLSEYQHYLDKAHEQRRIYLGKLNQTKNKVPPLRRETFVKSHLPPFDKYNDYLNINSYYNPSTFKIPPTTINSPLDFFIPLNPPLRYLHTPGQGMDKKTGKELAGPDTMRGDKKTLTLPPLLRKSFEGTVKSSCVCASNQIPCKCNCKQCLVQLNPTVPSNSPAKYPESPEKAFRQNSLPIEPRLPEFFSEDMSNAANTVNVKIKVDIQLPKIVDTLGYYNNQHNHDSAVEYEDISKDFTSNIRLPTTSFNFPIPWNMFGTQRSSKINKHDSSPFRKISIHKRKKIRTNSNSNNKRHRKKLITFHNIKISPTQTAKLLHNISENDIKIKFINETHQDNITENIKINTELNNYTTTSTEIPSTKNTTQLEDSIYFMVNISNNSENETDDVHKTGNSIELELTTKQNMSVSNVREKRDIGGETKHSSANNFTNTSINVIKQNNTSRKAVQKITFNKKPDKIQISDSELLYWPSSSQNITVLNVKNITDFIFEREAKKAKLNMSIETIRHNRTIALEQAIFGQVDWNDIDSIAPTFISFVGKYINGILTWCSEKICHSMKCAEKTCIHRTCYPEQRFNHIGHCAGSNKTDSVATIESITDLPSNVAFEIVDILQEKMFGKLYGKVTLCISSKCISFATLKKSFTKSKCAAKALNKSGHCPNTKKN